MDHNKDCRTCLERVLNAIKQIVLDIEENPCPQTVFGGMDAALQIRELLIGCDCDSDLDDLKFGCEAALFLLNQTIANVPQVQTMIRLQEAVGAAGLRDPDPEDLN